MKPNPFLLAAALALMVSAARLASVSADEPKTDDATAVEDNLAEEIRQKAPELLKHFEKMNWTNVGVLKFMVKKGDDQPSDNVGPLNHTVADRLQKALAYNNTKQKLGIIWDADQTVVAEKNTLANQLTEDGRKGFFENKYNVPWMTGKVEASAFVMGLVTISKDLRKTSLLIQAFDKEGKITELLPEIELGASPSTLIEAGYGYVLKPERNPEAFVAAKKDKRNRFPSAVLVNAVVEQAPGLAINFPSRIERDPTNVNPPKVEQKQLNPLKDGPIELTILYNGRPQPIYDEGRTDKPETGDAVSFVLRNRTNDYYAVVLEVNGINTLFEETFPDLKARHKWVLGPKKEQTVNGFQIDDSTFHRFKVLSPEASEEKAAKLGEDAGTIRMACFLGKIVKEDPSLEEKKSFKELDLERAVVVRGNVSEAFGKKAPKAQLESFKEWLKGREKQPDGKRCLIDTSDNPETKTIERLFFKYEYNTPVQVAYLRYFTPQKK